MRLRATAIILGMVMAAAVALPAAQAWDDCPFGYENEEYPGSCWRYTDSNDDDICDRSQEEPTASGGTGDGNGTTSGTDQSTAVTAADDGEEDDDDDHDGTLSLTDNKYLRQLVVSFLVVIGAIAATRLAVRGGVLSRRTEKILWNIALLVVFLPSAITGVMPALGEFLEDAMELHTLTSFFFMWVSAYHIIWHAKYYVVSARHLANGGGKK